jgi:hypothetical protein
MMQTPRKSRADKSARLHDLVNLAVYQHSAPKENQQYHAKNLHRNADRNPV